MTSRTDFFVTICPTFCPVQDDTIVLLKVAVCSCVDLDVGNKFCISLMQMNKKETYMDCFCQILDEEKIPYKIHGVFKNHLPISKLESAPKLKKDN